jgi:trimeric autotransporter adhesin
LSQQAFRRLLPVIVASEKSVMFKRFLASCVAVFSIGLAYATSAEAAYQPTPQAKYVPNNTVFAIAVTPTRIYIGGQFLRVTPIGGRAASRPGIAAFDRTSGALVPDFHPSFTSGAVRSIAVSADEQTVVVGGAFTTVNGVSHPKLAAVRASDGSLVPGWDTTASSTVRDIKVDGPNAYLGGAFGKVGGLSRLGLAKIDVATGTVDANWKPTTTGGRPTALTMAQNSLIVGGAFTTLAGAPRQFLGSVSLVTGAVTAWTPTPPCATCSVIDLAADSATNSVLAGMGGPGGKAVRYDAGTGGTKWVRSSDGNVQAITTDGTDVYVGGHFGPNPANELYAVDITTGTIDQTFAPSFPGNTFPGVWALEAAPEALYAGGGFVGVDGTTQSKYAVFPVAMSP